MKYIYIFIALFFCNSTLIGHGFSSETLVKLKQSASSIVSVCNQTRHFNKTYLTSYDTRFNVYVYACIKRWGWTISDRYIQFALNTHSKRDVITCTPTQEFFETNKQRWLPACQLNIGDSIQCANDISRAIESLCFIKKNIPVHMLEVDKTHTFFVGDSSILTHDIMLSKAIWRRNKIYTCYWNRLIQ